jgi:hypothetical protein
MTVDVAPALTVADAMSRLGILLDLAGIRQQLAYPEEAKGYGLERLDVLERAYRRFWRCDSRTRMPASFRAER